MVTMTNHTLSLVLHYSLFHGRKKSWKLKQELKKDIEEKLAKTKKDIDTEKDLSKKLAKLASIYFDLGKLGIIQDKEVLKNIVYGILENKIDIDSSLKDLEILIRDLDIKIENF